MIVVLHFFFICMQFTHTQVNNFHPKCWSNQHKYANETLYGIDDELQANFLIFGSCFDLELNFEKFQPTLEILDVIDNNKRNWMQ